MHTWHSLLTAVTLLSSLPLPPPPFRLSPPLQILFEETLFQNSSDGTPFVKMLQSKNIIPGIKVGLGSRYCLFVGRLGLYM